MPRSINEMTLAAYNEAGHTLIGILQGREVGPVWIVQGADGSWGGGTEAEMVQRSVFITLPPKYIYDRFGLRLPQGSSYFEIWEQCTFKLAAVEAEKIHCEQNGVDPSTVRLAKQDIDNAKSYVKILPEDQAQRTLRGSQALSRRILEDADCWNTLDALVQALTQGDTHTLEYAEIYDIAKQTNFIA